MIIKPLSNEALLEAGEVNMFLPNGEIDLDCGYLHGRQQVAQEAQKDTIRQIVEWGEEECKEHKHRMPLDRRDCPECWQELKQEANQ